MSHLHRFYAPFENEEGVLISLPPEEAHHALRVARLKPGDAVSVINGRGEEVLGALAPRGKHEADIEVRERIRHAPPRVVVTVALGGLHQDKAQQEVIRRAVETGVSRVCFWHADHSQKPVSVQRRWMKTAIEACKQCGRFYLPEIDTAPSLDALLDTLSEPVLIGMLEGDPAAPVTVAVNDCLAIVTGPEGDFSERERRLAAERGLTSVNLGGCVYRSETAASLLMTLAAHQLGELGPPLTLEIKSEHRNPKP